MNSSNVAKASRRTELALGGKAPRGDDFSEEEIALQCEDERKILLRQSTHSMGTGAIRGAAAPPSGDAHSAQDRL